MRRGEFPGPGHGVPSSRCHFESTGRQCKNVQDQNQVKVRVQEEKRKGEIEMRGV